MANVVQQKGRLEGGPYQSGGLPPQS